MLMVNESTVKRWSDTGLIKCFKTPGGHRKFKFDNIAGFIQKYNYESNILNEKDIIGSGAKSNLSEAVFEKNFGVLCVYLELLLLKNFRKDVFKFLIFCYTNKISLVDIYDKIIKPVQHNIGNLWQINKIGIEQEHAASGLINDSITLLHEKIINKAKTGKIALCGCIQGEQHEIGIKCVKNVLETEGWEVYYTGADLPVQAFKNSIDSVKPHLVCLSVTIPNEQTGIIIKEIFEHSHKNNAKVILGGSGINRLNNLHDYCDYSAFNSADILSFINQVK